MTSRRDLGIPRVHRDPVLAARRPLRAPPHSDHSMVGVLPLAKVSRGGMVGGLVGRGELEQRGVDGGGVDAVAVVEEVTARLHD